MTDRSEQFSVIIKDSVTGQTWWEAPYLRVLPFLPNTGWTDGDRHAYACLYAFLLRNGRPVGRVTFTTFQREGEEAYPIINDKYMVEASRHFDGRVAVPGQVELHECPEPSEEYSSFIGDQRPTVTYETRTGQVIEKRNYKTLVPISGVTFQQISKTSKKITVVAYRDTMPKIVIYYESMVPGVVMKSDL